MSCFCLIKDVFKIGGGLGTAKSPVLALLPDKWQDFILKMKERRRMASAII